MSFADCQNEALDQYRLWVIVRYLSGMPLQHHLEIKRVMMNHGNYCVRHNNDRTSLNLDRECHLKQKESGKNLQTVIKTVLILLFILSEIGD